MALFRFLAWMLLLIAIVALVSDLTRALNGGGLSFTTSYGYWKSVAPQSLYASTAFVQKTLHPVLWDPISLRVLLLPIWLLLGGIGLAMAVLGRRKRRVNIFAN